MFEYLPIQWLFLFYFYSFFGWCFESTYVTILEKKPVNRGFMRGPFLPLYGCGGVMMLIVSKPFYDNVLLVYVAGCVGATLLEYITGVTMEALFKVRYWDYSHKSFNYKGHICLESTLFWGVLTVVFSHFLQIPIERLVVAIPYNILSIISLVLTFGIGCDFMLAFKTALDLRDVLIYMEKAKAEMQKMQKRLDALITAKGETVKGGIETRVDALSATLESSFNKIREKINVNPSSYVNDVKDEISELYAKYRILMSKLTPEPIKGFFEWYREKTIQGNPSMVSEKFKFSLEEIKEKVSNIRKK